MIAVAGDYSRGTRSATTGSAIIDSLRGPVQFTHDALGNLAAATHADGRVEWRLPDAVGNLFQTRDRSDRKYGPAGQLTP